MVDAARSAAFAADDLQELKEAVCDAVLERTKRLVSGEGEHGHVVLGEKPSRALSSGFLLPRLNADGDDESSDIRIAAHGVDFRIRTDGPGEIQIRPSFSVYVRALPSADELFARNGRLVPSADFSGPAKARLRDEIRKRLEQAPKPETRAAKLAMREAVARAVMESMGVIVPSGARVASAEGDRDDDAAADAAVDRDVRTRLKIPNDVSRTYEVPHKWIRIPVHVSPLALSFPCDPDAWRQAGATYKPVLIDAARAAATAWITSPDGQAWAFRPRQVLSEELWGAAQWEQFLARARATAPTSAQLVPPLDIQILVDAVSDVLHPGIASLRIALENLREQDDRAESGIFGVSLEVDVADAAIVPLRLERVDRSYHLAGFLSMPAVGVNGGVDVREEVGGMRTLRTTWMPRYVLPRMRPAVLPRLPIAYEALANVATDVASLGDLADEMRHWIVGVEDTTRLSWPGESGSPEDEARQQIRFRADIAAWRREADRVERGADLLKRSQAAWRKDPHGPAAIPYRAWHLLNAAFAHANPDREDSSQKPGWRLFQLGFVLAHIPTLASRLPEYESDFDHDFDEDSASLLYMSTGGGKTEAFFGTIVFALFLDRLRGKHRGVTAMMHYPLRLLTIQQAQRLARLLAKAEIVRQTASLGGAPFEIGFWVGSSNTPNRTEQRASVITAEVQSVPTWQARPIADEARLSGADTGDRTYIAARDAWNKLPSCPFCGRPTGLRLFPEQHHRLGIVCTNEGGCPWGNAYKHQTAPEPLPFLLVDSDIYRRAPSILLGTVDKLALLGQSPQTVNRIAGMFGMARFVEGGDSGLLHAPDRDIDNVPPSYERLAPSWVDGRELFVDPFPSLIVQDEMHLLDESLGTFGGVFETALMAWLGELSTILGSRVCRVAADNRPRLPHVVGATATAADAAKHVGALYQKHVVQFPHPGPSLHDGFYVRLGEFTPGSAAYVERTEPTRSVDAHPREREIAAPWGRVYASLMTNGRLHTVTTLSVLAAHAATITRWLRDLGSGDSARQDRAAREIRDNISDAAWSDRRRAAVARQIEEAGYDLLAALVDLHRIELTYVTNKKGGDQILSAITAEVLETHEAMGAEYALSDFRMELISGGVDVKGIQSVIRKAEEPFDSRRNDVSAMLRGIVATSAISHGVDVEAFNAMVFAGMPTDIAEYIQASSRVGRLHVGFSLLVPTPQARRDRFVVGVHEPFHRLLERMIAPPAIERWADRALQRTIPSLMQTWLAGVYHQHAFVAAASEAKTTVRFPATVEAVDAIFKGAAGARNFDACVAFVQRAIGIDAVANGPGKAERYYRDVVRAGVHEVRAEIGSGSFTGFLRDFWANEQNPLRRRRPMLSLRDVDEAGTIQGSGLTLKNQRLRSGDLAAAMAVLRNRGVSRGRQSAMSEMDGEGTGDV